MENKDRIQKLYDLHVEGAHDMLKACEAADEDMGFDEGTFIDFEDSLSRELGVVKRSLNVIAEAFREISEDLAREKFYLEELRSSEDPQYQSFISREYGLLLSRLLQNHSHIEENYRLLSGKRDVWKGILEKLAALAEVYPSINEKMQRQWEILEEIGE